VGAKKFTINGAVEYGWNSMKTNIGILLTFTIITFVVLGGLNGAQRITVGEGCQGKVKMSAFQQS